MPEPQSPYGVIECSKLDVLDALFEGVLVFDSSGRVVHANAAAQEILRAPLDQLMARELNPSDWQLVGRDGQPLPPDLWPVARVLAGATDVRGELVGLRAGEGERAVWLSVNAVERRMQGTRFVLTTFVESSTPFGFRFHDVVESSRDIVVITDGNLDHHRQEIVYVNPAFLRLTGYSLDEVIGRSPRFLQGADTSAEARNDIREAIAAGKPIRTMILNYSKAGRPYWLDLQINPIHDADGRVTHFAAFERDMSDSQAELERAVHAANHDPLTGVLNRRGFIGLYEAMQARARRDRASNALMAIDIDHFKAVNDRFGHPEGDRILKHLVDLVRRRLRDSDLFARIGGEEFLVFASVLDSASALRLAESIRQLIRGSLTAGPENERVTVSIGLYVSDGRETLDDLINTADAQLYRAKNAGRDCVVHAERDQSERA